MTVMTNVVLVLKDSEGNIGIVKPLTDNDIIKIANAITDVGQVVDPATHMPIEATTASVGVVQLATAQDITNGTAGKVVDAKELINFAQTLPAVNGITDVSSGDNSNQLVVSKLGGSKTLTIDNVEHAGTATSADSVAWDKVSGKPSTFTPSDHDHSRYGNYFHDVCADTNTGWYESRYKERGDDSQVHLYINDYFGIHFRTTGSFDVNGHAIISEENIGSQSVNYANSAGSVAWGNVSGRPTALSQFTNDSGYITTDGAAYPRSVGGVTMNFNWSGQGGQPTWLWGGEDGTNMYVYNPANFSVNYANSAGNADTVDGSHAWQMQTLAADGSVHGGAWQLQCQHNVDGDSYFKLYCGDKSIGTKVDRASSAGWADTSGRVRTQSNSDWWVNCNWDGTYFQTNCISDGGSLLPINVQKANYADSAGSVAWGNVSGRPDIWIG